MRKFLPPASLFRSTCSLKDNLVQVRGRSCKRISRTNVRTVLESREICVHCTTSFSKLGKFRRNKYRVESEQELGTSNSQGTSHKIGVRTKEEEEENVVTKTYSFLEVTFLKRYRHTRVRINKNAKIFARRIIERSDVFGWLESPRNFISASITNSSFILFVPYFLWPSLAKLESAGKRIIKSLGRDNGKLVTKAVQRKRHSTSAGQRRQHLFGTSL